MQNKYCDLLERYQGYRITKDGRVWSDKRKKWLKTVIDRNGYVRVHLMINGKGKCMLVHRLVAETYIPNPNNLPQVNHKDECKTNNVVCFNPDGSIDTERTNLEWCDNRYNSTYGTAKDRTRKKLSKKVKQFTLDGKLVKVWDSTVECRQGGFSSGAISQCCKGGYFDKRRNTFVKITQHKGYKWSYE